MPIDDLWLPIYTRTPHGIYGISHVVVSNKNPILKRLNEYEENSFLDCHAVNPLTKEKIPIYLDSSDDYGEKGGDNSYFLDSKLAVPTMEDKYKEFASNHNLNYREIIDTDTGKLINSDEVNKRSKYNEIKVDN